MHTTVAISPVIEASWKQALAEDFSQDYFKTLKAFLLAEKAAGHRVYPRGNDIFNAFTLTPFDAVKVVILGQDPYHGEGQAHGLAFSVQKGIGLPPSLKNIFKELQADVGFVPPGHGDLSAWAKQGVLLLNTVLTVRAQTAHSHQKKGWEFFTDAVIRKLNAEKDHLVFVLWGGPAKTKRALIDSQKHLVLTAAHPSPLSAYNGFFGCRHFSKINQYLQSMGQAPIDWQL